MTASETTSKDFAISRVLNAPRGLVWKCFTDPARMKQWWGPKGFKVLASKMDLRPGGTYHYGMQAPNGQTIVAVVLGVAAGWGAGTAAARLLPVSERAKTLFGKEEAKAPAGKSKKFRQKTMFDGAAQEAAEDAGWGELNARQAGATVLDRLHQTMILFAAGRGEAIRRFLVEDGVGRDTRFWKLAQAMSALYPAGTEEKRWVDGVLARKKGLGF